ASGLPGSPARTSCACRTRSATCCCTSRTTPPNSRMRWSRVQCPQAVSVESVGPSTHLQVAAIRPETLTDGDTRSYETFVPSPVAPALLPGTEVYIELPRKEAETAGTPADPARA